MIKQIVRFAKWSWFGLFQEKVPLWLHVATLMLTVLATVVLAPNINSVFEKQKIRSAFVIDSLASINSLTGDLAVSITAYNYCELNRPNKCDSEIRAAQGNIVRLQWKAVQLRAILNTPEDRAAIRRFQVCLDAVGVALNARNSQSKLTELERREAAFGMASVDLVRRVALQAGITT